MTLSDRQALTEQYATALWDFCLNPDAGCSKAYELGDRAAGGLTMTELIHIYQHALASGLRNAPVDHDSVAIAVRAADFLAQSLLPFEAERQQTEAALRRSEEQFRVIFETAAIGIVVTDSDHKIAHANPFFRQTLGYSADEMVAFDFVPVTHPEDVALERPFIEECLAGTRDTYRLEKRYIRKDGKTIWSDMTGTVVRDASGQIQYSVVTMADITEQQTARHERRQAELALQQLNAELENRVQTRTAELQAREAEIRRGRDLFAGIFEASADAIFLVSPVTDCIVNCNQQAIELFEVDDREALIGIVGSVFHKEPFPPEEVVTAYAQLETVGGWSQEIEYLTRKGNTFWGNCTAKRIHVAGEPLHLVRIIDITDRKRIEAERQQAEAALHQSEARFRQIAANLPGMLYQYVTHPDGSATYTYVSSGCQQVCEVDPAAVLADSTLLWRMTHPEDLPSLQQAVAACTETMQPLHHEHRIITPTGRIKWVQLNSDREQQENGDVVADGVAIDITARKQAEAALHQSETRFHQLAANIPGAFYQSVLHPDGSRQYTYISSGYQRIFEADPAVLLADANTFWQMAHPDDIKALQEEVIRTLETLQPFQFEYRIVTPSGRIKWIHNVANRQPLPNGDVMSDGVTLDITDRKQAEIALQESEEKFRQLAENIESVFWMVDTSDRLLYASPSYEQIWGRTLESVYQRHETFLEAIHPDDLPLLLESIASKVASNGYDIVYRVIRPDGDIRWVRDRAFPVRNQQGEIYRFAGIAEDFSALKQAEVQLRAALQEKDVLLKEIHHRVKNNLQVVSALLSLKAESIQDPALLAVLQDSENRLQAMALIHETLYQADNLRQLNFSHYIQRLADSILLANSTRSQAINLTYQLEPVFLNLETAIPCGLLLNELVTNAIKHAFPNQQQGEICITLQRVTEMTAIAKPPSPADRPQYILSVSDNGIGMPELDLQQLKSLGLRIAFDLTQQLRGTLELERSSGTQFHLTFAELNYRQRF